MDLDQERQILNRKLFDSAVLHRPQESIGGIVGTVRVDNHDANDGVLVSRIIKAFDACKSLPLGDSDSFWLDSIAGMQKREFETLSRGNPAEVSALFRNPQHTQLFVGFDDVMADNPYTPHFSDPGFQEWCRLWAYDSLICLAEALGVIPVEAVEARRGRLLEVEDILVLLDDAFGFRIGFPNINEGEVGLATSRGIASFRALQSLFQGWRIANLLKETGGKSVVEIGGGLGRTCYYARQFGVPYYTIVDLPITSACQAYFLGRVLGDDQVALHDEDGAPVRLIAPSTFLRTLDRHDLAVNVDSFPEMSGNTIAGYFHRIKHSTPMLLSINHEGNLHTVRYFIKTTEGASSTRNPYWLRRGYVEEVVRFASVG